MNHFSFFSSAVLDFYQQHSRVLPWRAVPVNAYHVVVAEFMLQQTQVSRVIDKFIQFLQQFPTIQELARSVTADVIKAWSGLGYNKRALLLQRFAQEVYQKHQGRIPETRQALQALSGVGPYMAGSIASFAFNQPEPAIDVNVRRIYLRFFHGKDQGKPMSAVAEADLFRLVQKTIPAKQSRDFHNALMDFGSLICMRKNPACTICPLAAHCQFRETYQIKGGAALFVMEKKRENGRTELGRHIPNRIFRGRIVEFTRQKGGRSVSLTEFGQLIKKDYTEHDAAWLLLLCRKLHDEGLISFIQEEQDVCCRLPQ